MIMIWSKKRLLWKEKFLVEKTCCKAVEVCWQLSKLQLMWWLYVVVVVVVVVVFVVVVMVVVVVFGAFVGSRLLKFAGNSPNFNLCGGCNCGGGYSCSGCHGSCTGCWCSSLWTGLVILIWKLFSMSGYRKYINGIWFWHRNPNFGLKKSWKAKKGHKGQWRPAKAKKVQNSKNL